MEEAIQNFQKYVAKFNIKDNNIKLKIAHTMRVVKLAQDLSLRLNLPKDEEEVFLLIALLHDIGRFYQLECYNSFSDLKFDHADYGIKYLFTEGHIREYNKEPLNDDFIKAAIYYHNRYLYDIPVSGLKRKYIDLIRDVDKIDIFYTMYLNSKQEFKKEDITAEELKDFYKHIPTRTVKELNKSEIFLVKCAYIYEFNFRESLEILKEKGYLDLFFKSVLVDKNSKELFQDIKNKVYEELEDRLQEKKLGERSYVRKKV